MANGKFVRAPSICHCASGAAALTSAFRFPAVTAITFVVTTLLKSSLAALAIAASTGALRADVTPNPLFADNAVLQQGVKVPVWGTADPGEKISVEFAGQMVVSHPVAVRYAWANVPEGNLFNRAGLPASPFRTGRE